MSKRVKVIAHLLTLVLVLTGCLLEENPPSNGYQNDYWGYDVHSKEEFLNQLKLRGVDLSGGVFSVVNTNENEKSLGNYAFIQGYMILQSRVTAKQFAIFLSDIGCEQDGTYLGKKYFEPSNTIQFISDSINNQYYFEGDINSAAVNVTWFGAQSFCTWSGGRLPTETEWAFAVGQLSGVQENLQGELYGICGASWENENGYANQHTAEWCFDWYSETFGFDKIVVNPQGANSGTERVVRGGYSTTNDCSDENRKGLSPDMYNPEVGFRCVWDKEDGSSEKITISTLPVNNISSTTAVLNSSISGASTEISSVQCGFLWDTIPNPNFERCIGIAKSTAGGTKYSVEITGLDYSQIYYVVSFALYRSGMSIGQEVTFTTLPAQIGSQNGLIDLEMVDVPGGKYTSVNGDASISSFRMSKYEVTNLQFCAYLNAIQVKELGSYLVNSTYFIVNNGVWSVISGFENYPVVNVVWGKANEFCRWAGGRLPVKEEWDYAAGGGQKGNGKIYAGSDDVNEVCWYNLNSYNFHTSKSDIHSVGQKQANELGLYDMCGNVSEWCANSLETSEALTKGGSYRTSSNDCKISSAHYAYKVPQTYDAVGFRLVRNMEILGN